MNNYISPSMRFLALSIGVGLALVLSAMLAPLLAHAQSTSADLSIPPVPTGISDLPGMSAVPGIGASTTATTVSTADLDRNVNVSSQNISQNASSDSANTNASSSGNSLVDPNAISQIGNPISHFIKCDILSNFGPPIPAFSSECNASTTPPGPPGPPSNPPGHTATGTLTGEVVPCVGTVSGSGGSLTGQVVGTSTSSSNGATGTLTGTVVSSESGTLTGEVVAPCGQTQVGGESANNGGGGSSGGTSGSSPSGGGGGGGGTSPGQVLGASTGPSSQPGGVGGYVPGVPSTGAGGNAGAYLLILLASAVIAATGVGYLVLARHA